MTATAKTNCRKRRIQFTIRRGKESVEVVEDDFLKRERPRAMLVSEIAGTGRFALWKRCCATRTDFCWDNGSRHSKVLGGRVKDFHRDEG